ncbi:hypothetical protein OKA04_00940 [Luteolibacter flavescens]|uniref:Legume lectin domain-containing protein n=1 Tax=Luteolibacter flavescens TaxID=1859460 RepID=A0ABT3FI74_9BACT|nr:hypothetical protein [Luteolibacter flavescens]MCW1883273.1 hypothetical protein [Luteolibacter flavescens]
MVANADFSFESFAESEPELTYGGWAEAVNGILRLTPMERLVSGDAWHVEKQTTAGGFDTSFSFKLHRPDDNYYYGTDGVVFVVHNHQYGLGASPTSASNGITQNALNIKFDSWVTAPSDGSASSVQVRNGTTILATVNLSTVPGVTLDTPPPEGPPGGGPAGGFPSATITVRSSKAPYDVRVVYRPGALDVYFQGIKVINELAVDLGAIGAADEEGKSYIGFSATTAAFQNAVGEIDPSRVFTDLTQFTDISRWSFTSGAPQVETPLTLVSHAFNLAESKVTLDWTSVAGKTYRVTTSDNLQTWVPVVGAETIPATGASTSVTVDIPAGAKNFFRVEEN